MSATWHPLSTILLPDPPMFATRRLLEMILAAEADPEILYAGDRMWPTVAHGARVRVERTGGTPPRPGEVVLAAAGAPDLLRVVGHRSGRAILVGDADPGGRTEVSASDVLGRARLPARRVSGLARAWSRLRIDLREARREAPDSGVDAAGTVRAKYDAQAPFYAAANGPELEASLAARIQARVRRGGRILVAGSGSGHETLALAELGYDARGVDFSPEMVEAARGLARARGSRARFVLGNLLEHEEGAGSLDAVLFTYEVYSFLEPARARGGLLARMREWLAPGGVVFLSARRLRWGRDAAMLALAWASRGGRQPFGDSHTRWIGGDGGLRRSFVHVFTRRGLGAEIAAAGFAARERTAGHVVLEARDA